MFWTLDNARTIPEWLKKGPITNCLKLKVSNTSWSLIVSGSSESLGSLSLVWTLILGLRGQIAMNQSLCHPHHLIDWQAKQKPKQNKNSPNHFSGLTPPYGCVALVSACLCTCWMLSLLLLLKRLVSPISPLSNHDPHDLIRWKLARQKYIFYFVGGWGFIKKMHAFYSISGSKHLYHVYHLICLVTGLGSCHSLHFHIVKTMV